MAFRKAERRKAKLRLGLAGPSGSGKTYSALLIARGVAGSWDKVAVIDTENGSADLYAHLGDYSVCTLNAPFTVDKYIQTIHEAEKAGFSVIIVDSLTHAWEQMLDDHGKAKDSNTHRGNGYTAWREFTPKHNEFVQTMLQSPCHIIATARAKSDYIQTENDKGRKEIRKVGMGAIVRPGMEYEFTAFLDLDQNHTATASKDRTGIFDKQYPTPSVEIGERVLQWLDDGIDMISNETMEAIKQEARAKGLQGLREPMQAAITRVCKLEQLTEDEAQKLLQHLKELPQPGAA